jgi:hypothetical protein
MASGPDPHASARTLYSQNVLARAEQWSLGRIPDGVLPVRAYGVSNADSSYFELASGFAAMYKEGPSYQWFPQFSESFCD